MREGKPARGARGTGAAAALLVALAAPAAAQTVPFEPLPEPGEVNEARADLGRMLSFDTRLSGDTGTACASCHAPEKGWGDGQPLSDGYPVDPLNTQYADIVLPAAGWGEVGEAAYKRNFLEMSLKPRPIV